VLVGSDRVVVAAVGLLMRPGRMNRQVSLTRAPQTPGDSDGYDEKLSPYVVWAQIEPLDPSSNADGTRLMASRVTMRYHSQVTVDTQIALGTRKLMVKGVQNVDDNGAVLVLFCEEVIP
jgi:head-tail adaptor